MAPVRPATGTADETVGEGVAAPGPGGPFGEGVPVPVGRTARGERAGDGPINPAGWKPPKGYNNGYRLGNILFIGGQIAWDAEEHIVGPGDLVVQFGQALRNVRAVVQAAGGQVEDVGRLTVYVTDRQAYLEGRRALGSVWREVFGRHYPAMALVVVAALVEGEAMVEIEATALLGAMEGA